VFSGLIVAETCRFFPLWEIIEITQKPLGESAESISSVKTNSSPHQSSGCIMLTDHPRKGAGIDLLRRSPRGPMDRTGPAAGPAWRRLRPPLERRPS
jgi:hypothetical protein